MIIMCQCHYTDYCEILTIYTTSTWRATQTSIIAQTMYSSLDFVSHVATRDRRRRHTSVVT